MKLKKVLVTILIVTMSIITGCHQKPPTKEEEFKVLLENINNSREVFHKKPLPKIENYIGNSSVDDVIFEEGELEAMIPKMPQNSFNDEGILTRKEALADVESLFKLLRSAYSLYNHFGGDTTFSKAKQEIIAEINNVEEISNGNLVNLLKSKLTFIKDGHFRIGKIDELKLYYSYKEENFLRDNKGIYKVSNNKKYYLKSIDSKENIEDFLKLTINDEGKLVYVLGFSKISNVDMEYAKQNYNYCVGVAELPIKICYESKGKKFEEGVNFKTEKEVNYQFKDSFSLEMSKNIPVVTFNNIDVNTSMTQISKTTDKLKGHNIAIMDLRGNYGGSMLLVDRFSEKMSIPNTSKRAIAQLYSEPIIFQQQYRSSDKLEYRDELNKFVITDKFNSDTSLADNDKLIIALIDVNVASAGEGFIRRLCTMKNVILVGSNSNGANLARNMCHYKLPNSNAIVNLGSAIYVCADIDEFELNGFTPDIWVNSTESMDKVMKFIKSYNLESFKK